MKGCKMNFATKTLTITKDFSDKAMIINSYEHSILLHCQSICPDLRIAYKTHCTKTRNPKKGLTFNKMERYIRLFDNADELIIAFSKVKAIADFQPNKYDFVYKWFMKQFPNYKNVPSFENGELKVESIVSTSKLEKYPNKIA